jgi:CCR4-NOT transcription complex subunit 6
LCPRLTPAPRRYSLTESHLLEFRGLAIARADFKKTQEIFNRVMNRDHIGVVCLFEAVASGARVVIANTHLFWDAAFRDVKLVQTGLLCEQLERITHEFAQYPPRPPVPGARPAPVYADGSRIPLVLCGDFNSVAGSGVYELLANGGVPPGHADWMGHQYGQYTADGVRHRLGLKNAYAGVELAMTNYTPSFQGVLDYVWFGGAPLALNAVLGEVDKGYLEKVVGFPNAAFPSDHICLAAEFRVKPPRALVADA